MPCVPCVSYVELAAAQQQFGRESMVKLAAVVLGVQRVRTTSVPSEHDSERLIALYSDLQIPKKEKINFIYLS